MPPDWWNPLAYFSPDQPPQQPVNQLAARIASNPVGTQVLGPQLTNPSPLFDPVVYAGSDGSIATASQWQDAQAKAAWGRHLATVMAMGMTGGVKDIGATADRVAKMAEGMGYSVARDGSNVSGSQYLNLTHDSLPDDSIKVRVSDHDLPPSYEQPHFDIDAGGAGRGLGANWYDVVSALAGRAGVKVPPEAQRMITRDSNVAAAQRAADEARRVAEQERLAARAPIARRNINDTLREAYPDAAPQEGVPGSRNVWRQLRQKFESEFPGQAWWKSQ